MDLAKALVNRFVGTRGASQPLELWAQNDTTCSSEPRVHSNTVRFRDFRHLPAVAGDGRVLRRGRHRRVCKESACAITSNRLPLVVDTAGSGRM